MNDLKKTWEDYYTRDIDTAIKDRNFFNMEVNTIIEYIGNYIFTNPSIEKTVLELGCGTGFLIKQIFDKFKDKQDFKFIGVDFSKKAIDKANKRNIPNSTFVEDDMIDFLITNEESYDIIITQRSIMAIMDKKRQILLLKSIKKNLKDGGCGIFSEGLVEAVEKINELRKELNLEPIKKVWHSRYLTKNELKGVFDNMELIDYSSTYWLITRVIYPYFEEPVHNSKIADFAAKLPQLGDFSFVKLIIVRKL